MLRQLLEKQLLSNVGTPLGTFRNSPGVTVRDEPRASVPQLSGDFNLSAEVGHSKAAGFTNLCQMSAHPSKALIAPTPTWLPEVAERLVLAGGERHVRAIHAEVEVRHVPAEAPHGEEPHRHLQGEGDAAYDDEPPAARASKNGGAQQEGLCVSPGVRLGRPSKRDAWGVV